MEFNDYDFSQQIDEIEENICDFFQTIESIKKDSRHKSHALLLDCRPAMEPLGLDPDVVINEFGAEGFKGKDQASEISQFIWNRFNPTYLVSSYWSPLDPDQRRSIVFRDRKCEGQFPQATAYACVFFALTLLGCQEKFKLYTLVQYMNEAVKNKNSKAKNGLFSCMPGISNVIHDEESFEKSKRWLYFPQVMHASFLLKMGIEDLINQIGLDNKTYVEILEELLNGLPLIKEKAINEKIEDYLKGFKAHCLNLLKDDEFKEEKKVIKSSLDKLKNYFPNDDSITEVEVCFILTTHLMWQRACCYKDTTYMYVFPTYVSDKCCMLTMGTKRRLEALEEIGVARIAHSLFVYPLLLDYRAFEKRHERIRYLQTYGRLLGHNFPKTLIAPAVAQLKTVENELKNADKLNDTKHFLHEIDNRIKVILSIFEHNETLMTVALKPRPHKNMFSKDLEDFYFSRIFERFEGITHLYKEKGVLAWADQEHATAFNYKVSMTPELSALWIRGHLDFIQEMLINILVNAYEQIERSKLQKDLSLATVNFESELVTLNSGQKVIQIVVKDSAGGFTESQFDLVTKKISGFESVSEERFNSYVSDKVLGSVIESKDSIHGIGLIFCAAYLHSLKWMRGIGEKGSITIENIPRNSFYPDSKGARIVLHIPFLLGLSPKKNEWAKSAGIEC